MTELSEEMLDAIRILRSDERAKAYKDMTKSHQDLVQRLDKKDADDQTWRKEWEERNAQAAGGTQTQGDPPVGDPGGNPTGTTGGPPESTVPLPPEVTEPPRDEKPKRKSKWWGDLED